MPDAIQLIIPGHERKSEGEPVEQQKIDLSRFLNVNVKKGIEVGISVRGVPRGQEQVRHDVAENEVIELEFEGGVCQWISAEQLSLDLGNRNPQLVTRGTGGIKVVQLPADLGASTERGMPDLVLKGLKVFGIEPTKTVSDLAVRKVVSRFEDNLEPGVGLYRLREPRIVESQVQDAKELDATAPYLLLLHGTASSIAGSFGGLAPSPDDKDEPVPPDDWNALRTAYPNRILALQHKTFSESPVKNALDVARLLPQGARLHLISHSRGGLVGELLCLTDLNDSHFLPFENAAKAALKGIDDDKRKEILETRKEEAAHIKQLAELLREKHFQVERFVRVACPARGTILASRRMDLYLSVMLNVFGFLPALKNSVLYAFLKATTLELARRKADPRQLPGIEAMMPESPLVHLLNQDEIASTADLAVISGDLAPKGIWQRLKTLAAEVFYLRPNDLVVNTMAMYGGMERRKGATYFFNKGPHVNHFRYFRNAGTRSRLRSWLEAKPGASVEGFRSFVREERSFEPDRRRGETNRPVLFFLPDLLGTQLSDDNGPIWISRPGLAKSGRDRLADAQAKLKVEDMLPDRYARLINELQGDYEVELFRYDWRKSLLDEEVMGRFRAQVCKHLDANRAVSFLAHGSGGLLVRLLAKDDALWDRVLRKSGRVVMLGTPNPSSSFAAHLLIADCELNRLLNMVDQESETHPEDMFRAFPGVLELVPARLKDILQLTDSELAQGETFRGDLAKLAPLKNAVYVAGKAGRTPFDVTKDPASNKTIVLTTVAGDGRVSWEESKLDGMPAWQMNVPHGSLVDHPPAFTALRELLSRGTTQRLSKMVFAPAVADSAPLFGNEPLFYPTNDELIDAALGAETAWSSEEPAHPLMVSVSHGHLRQAKYLAMVGHYQDDTIASAEKVLDNRLAGRLTERFLMGLYPGRDGTSEVVLAPGHYPRGGLVVGLGEVGGLTPEKLRRGVTVAALRYALLLLDEKARTRDAGLQAANFSAVMIGAYGEISVRDSVAAVVKGALEANRQLKAQKLDELVRIQEIEFIELFQDVANQAAHELLILADRMNGDLSAGEILRPQAWVRELEGGQSSRPLNQHATGWWRRIKISRGKSDSLEYTVLTDRARADDYVQGTQRRLVDSFVQQAMRSTGYNEELSATLFQLLIPRSLRDYAQDKVNLVLVLDVQSASYPWELLAQRTRAGVDSLATSFGLIRQLKSDSSERRLNSASGNHALIVGDTESGWSPLPGARKEAEIVTRLLQGKYQAHPLPPDVDALRLVSELFSREYRIVHLAGHGHFDSTNPARSGMKIGPDLWLTPAELRGLMAAPDLVFVNCCHLGAMEGKPGPHLAASFATTLMDLGVKAVVAAGWAVHDVAAQTFADRFYEWMLAGETFGDAVLAARQRVQQLHPSTNSWGAYQCYGNPDFRLLQPETGREIAGDTKRKRRFVSRSEVLQRLKDVATTAADQPKDRLLQELEELREQTPVEWRDGEILAAFGKAHGALGDFAAAISAYEQALADERSSAPLRVVQDMANLMDRHARSLSGEERGSLLGRAIEQLESLSRLVDTGEQASLLGGFYKRQHDAARSDDERQKAWREALRHYERGYSKRKETGNDELYYPGLNAAALALVLKEADREKWTVIARDSTQAAARQRDTVRDFWSRASVADGMLLGCLWDGTLVEKESEITSAYVAVIESGGTVREFQSMLGQIQFLSGALAQDTGDGPRTCLQRIFEEVSSRIPQ